MAIKLLITDFDGTLVDTFEANYRAYRESFARVGIGLSETKYRECFGLRFDRFMDAMGITDMDTRALIKNLKGDCYPKYFDSLKVNYTLLSLLRNFRASGGMTAIASTAREKNLRNALRHIGAESNFNLILAGEDVTSGKPNPEIYNTVLKRMCCLPEEALIFEDSQVGFEAAIAANINYIPITQDYFKNGN